MVREGGVERGEEKRRREGEKERWQGSFGKEGWKIGREWKVERKGGKIRLKGRMLI